MDIGNVTCFDAEPYVFNGKICVCRKKVVTLHRFFGWSNLESKKYMFNF